MTGPTTEFRTLPVSTAEPADRTVDGVIVASGFALDLGEVDTTDEPQYLPVRVFWFRVADMGDASEITNIRVWIEGADLLTGTDRLHLDITDTWTRNKTPTQVVTGAPGNAPLDRPEPNLTAMGGGPITGCGHDDTSRYIYLTGMIGLDESAGEKTGLTLRVTYDYH